MPKVLSSRKESGDVVGQRNVLALSAVIIGNGFFKPNISTMVGTLYAPGDTRRDGGFTIFYMGINLGSTLSQFLCPFLADALDGGLVLAAAGGMMVSWALFQFDGGRLKDYGNPQPGVNPSAPLIVTIGALLAIPCMWFLLHNTMISAEAAATAAEEGTGILGYIASLPVLAKCCLRSS